MAGRIDDRGDRLFGQRRTAKIGVQHGAGEVEDAAQLCKPRRLDAPANGKDQRGGSRQRRARAARCAHACELRTHRIGDDAAAMHTRQLTQRGLSQQAIDGGEGGEGFSRHDTDSNGATR